MAQVRDQHLGWLLLEQATQRPDCLSNMLDSQVDHLHLGRDLVHVAAMGGGQDELCLDLPLDEAAEQVDHHAFGTSSFQGWQETGQPHFGVMVFVQ